MPSIGEVRHVAKEIYGELDVKGPSPLSKLSII